MARARITPAKAAEMLRNPPRGKPLSGKQEHLFQGIKHGMKPTRLKKPHGKKRG